MSVLNDICGPSGSGKSTLFPSASRCRYVYFPIGFFYLIFKPRLFFIVIRASCYSDSSFVRKLAALMHSVMKFSLLVLPFSRRSFDEGVAQIPFILMFNSSDLEIFVINMQPYFARCNIVFVYASPDVRIERLFLRGHKKANSYEDYETLVSRYEEIFSCYIRLLDRYNLPYRVVKN